MYFRVNIKFENFVRLELDENFGCGYVRFILYEKFKIRCFIVDDILFI